MFINITLNPESLLCSLHWSMLPRMSNKPSHTGACTPPNWGNSAVQASQASRQLRQNLEAEGRHVTEFLLTVDQTISPLQQVNWFAGVRSDIQALHRRASQAKPSICRIYQWRNVHPAMPCAGMMAIE